MLFVLSSVVRALIDWRIIVVLWRLSCWSPIMEPEFSLRCSQEPAREPVRAQFSSSHQPPPHFFPPPHKGPPRNLSGHKFSLVHTPSSCSQRTRYGTPNVTIFSSVRWDVIIKARLFTRRNIAWLVIGPGLYNSDSLSTRTHFPSV